MSREIKFRAWVENSLAAERGDTSVYPYMNYKIEFSGGLLNDNFALSGVQVPNKLFSKITYMQYTGLKDKNGKEIYEGDIVNRDVYAFGEIRTFTGEVKMFECAWWIDSGTAAVPLWNEMHELDIIGNIYENPELLEVTA